MTSPLWMEDAACAGMNPDPWFGDDARSVAYAKSVCATCPVRTACLDYAVRHRILHGTWGGQSSADRRRVRRKRSQMRRTA